MNKIYNITQDMADKLYEGQVFKNFRALSEYLNILDRNGCAVCGSSKRQIMAELNRYVVLEKEKGSFCYTVKKIRSKTEILSPRPKGGNNKYGSNIKEIIRYQLSKISPEVENGNIDVFWTLDNIAKACGMINEDFDKPYTQVYGDEVRVTDIINFKRKVRSSLKEYIYYAFEEMKKNKEFISCNYTPVFISKELGRDKLHIPTEVELRDYNNLFSKVIHSFKKSSGEECKNEQDIFLSGRSSYFYNELQNKFTDIFPYDSVYSMYHIIIDTTSIKRMRNNTNEETCLECVHRLNDAICENIPKLANIKRGRKVREEYIVYTQNGAETCSDYVEKSLSKTVIEKLVYALIYIPNEQKIPCENYIYNEVAANEF